MYAFGYENNFASRSMHRTIYTSHTHTPLIYKHIRILKGIHPSVYPSTHRYIHAQANKSTDTCRSHTQKHTTDTYYIYINVCVYVYIYMYIYIYVCMYVHWHIYIYTYTHTHYNISHTVCACMCIYIYIYVCVCVCVYVYLSVYGYASVYAGLYVCKSV